jgi:tyrosinase
LDDVNALTSLTTLDYDRTPWDSSANTSGFRSRTESRFHDEVHVLVGGNTAEMAIPQLACNDPIFFLHHAMVDRLWARWQDTMVEAGTSLSAQYHPTMSEAAGIQFGHRLDEPMWPWSDRVEMERWAFKGRT